MVAEVTAGGNGAKAGVQAGDVLLATTARSQVGHDLHHIYSLVHRLVLCSAQCRTRLMALLMALRSHGTAEPCCGPLWLHWHWQ